MARRKKAAEGFHKNQIALAAGKLFVEKGIEKTTMDDIAKESGYGKATLYVYYKNKDEIISTLALDSMKLLLQKIKSVINEGDKCETQYLNICGEIFKFNDEFPQYFTIAVSKIGTDTNDQTESETYDVGEQINEIIAAMLFKGIKNGELRTDIEVPLTIYTFWASIYGIITMTKNKAEYINKSMGIDSTELMNLSFKLLFESIRRRV